MYQLAQEQSVQGVVLRGIEELRVKSIELCVPKVLLLQWIGEVQMIEQRNKDMNVFVAEMIDKLRKNDVYAILVKGQGIAQCYDRSLWRVCGDVDLLLDEDNYIKAKSFLLSVAQHLSDENQRNLHLAMTIDIWEVELHGSLRSHLWKNIEDVIDEVQKNTFDKKDVRVWKNGDTDVYLPSANNDVIFVFTHILQHFFLEGVGLRQVCDWCRLLWIYRDEIDVDLLESRLRRAGILSEWKALGSMSVEWLGMSEEAMPLYSPAAKWKRKAGCIMNYILETGNMGHNRDWTYFGKYPYVIRKIISLCRHTWDIIRIFFIFPMDSVKMWGKMMGRGLGFVVEGK